MVLLWHWENNNKNPFLCLSLILSSCANCYAFVFKNKFLSLSHSPYHITSLLQTSKSKNPGSTNLKNRISYTLKPTGESVIVFVKVKTTVF